MSGVSAGTGPGSAAAAPSRTGGFDIRGNTAAAPAPTTFDVVFAARAASAPVAAKDGEFTRAACAPAIPSPGGSASARTRSPSTAWASTANMFGGSCLDMACRTASVTGGALPPPPRSPGGVLDAAPDDANRLPPTPPPPTPPATRPCRMHCVRRSSLAAAASGCMTSHVCGVKSCSRRLPQTLHDGSPPLYTISHRFGPLHDFTPNYTRFAPTPMWFVLS